MKATNSEGKSKLDKVQCWIENPQSQVLLIELKDGTYHLCPYSWLVWGKISSTETSDKITLTFNSHTVSITGKNLTKLVLAFQQMSVELVRVQPERRAETAVYDTPLIQEIQVQERSAMPI